MATTNVEVIISARDNASSVLKNFSNTATSAGKNISGSLKEGFSDLANFADKVLFTTALAGAGFITLATKAAFSASRVDELTLALHAIGKANNITAKETDKAVVALRKNNISYEDALQVTARFIQNELKLTDAIKLSNVAKDLAVIAGLGSSDATNILTQAISGQSVMMLRQFGIVTTLDDAYEKYGSTLGKTSQDLTQAEKKQALFNIIIEGGTKVVGVYEAAMQSSGKQFRSFTTRILPDFIVQLGRAFEPSLLIIVNELTASVKNLSTWFSANKEAVAIWGTNFSNAIKTGIDAFKAFVDFLMNNQGIVIGVLTAFGVAIALATVSFIGLHASALLIISVFAAVGLAIQSLIEGFQQGNILMIALGVGITTLIGLIAISYIPTITAAILANVAWLASFIALLAPFLAIALAVTVLVAGIIWLIQQTLLLTNSQYAAEVQTNNLKSAKEALQKATENLARAEDNTKAATNRLETATLMVERAQRSYTEAVNIHGPTSLEAREAANRLKLAQDGVTQATTSVEDATKKEMEMQTKAIQKHKEVVDAANPVKSAFDSIAGAIGNAIGKLQQWIGLKSGSAGGGSKSAGSWQTGGIVPGPIGAPVVGTVHGGEEITPVGLGDGGGSDGNGVTFNIHVGMYAGTEIEKRNIAKTLYSALLQVAQSQNKNVKELMGG